jgi:hypothetical protein
LNYYVRAIRCYWETCGCIDVSDQGRGGSTSAVIIENYGVTGASSGDARESNIGGVSNASGGSFAR